MSIHEIDRTSTLDLGQDVAVVCENAEAESQGIGEDGEHGQNPAEHEVESDEAEEDVRAPTAAPPTSATAANAKKAFGMKRPKPAVKKGAQNTSISTSYLNF